MNSTDGLPGVWPHDLRAGARRTGHYKNTIRKLLENKYTGYSPRKHQPFPELGPYTVAHPLAGKS